MYKIKKNEKMRLVSLLVAFTMMIGLITMPSQNVYAEESSVIFQEGFTGDKNSVKAGEGWVFNPSAIGGYDTNSNFGQEKPSLKLSGKGHSVESPEFKLDSEGILSFWIKGQNIANSSLDIKVLIEGEWATIKSINAEENTLPNNKGDVVIVDIPQEATKIKLEYNKETSNVAIDDIKLSGKSGGENPEPPVEGLVTIQESREMAIGEEAAVRGIVSFNDRNQTIHIQDKTGAIAVSNFDSKIDLSSAVSGTEIEVKGIIKDYNALLQIQATEMKVLSTKGQPNPKVVTIKELKEKNYDSNYIEVKNARLDVEAKTLTQDGEILDIYFIPAVLDVKTGDIVNVKGTVGRFNSTVQIYGSSCIFEKVDGEPEVPEGDKVGPEVSNLKPQPGSNIKEDRKPEISATFLDESGVNMDSVKMLLNEVDVTEKLTKTENTVKYSVEEELVDGIYTVIIEVKDTLDNITRRNWSFTIGESSKNLYFGQLHSHTNLSDGQGTVDDAYSYARDNANLDFFAVTDHSNWFDNDIKANIADGSQSVAWNKGQDAANKYNEDGEFAALYGYEMTWSGSTGGYGHMNTFNTPGFETRTNKNMDLKTYYSKLKTQSQSISQFNHPGKTFGDFSDFGLYDTEIDKRISLVEVGNGEGPVNGSGYFRSYEYYTRALDKGWHVAPTNNQDNHKGKWGNANSARTVIEAPNLSRESVYDALTDMRVYSTEDENLRISYEVNGSTMGSKLEETDELNFNINIEDIDLGDNIKKISIIGDGGKVINYIDNVNNTSKTWDFTLDSSNSSYYYVKVEQADKEVAVTAPVWVGEKENVGISTVDVDTEVIVAGEEFNVLTNIYNNEGVAINDVKVEYYLNAGEEPIYTEIIEKIDAAGTAIAKLPYTFDKAGDHSFTVKVTATVNGNIKEFKGSINVEVVNSNEISKVVIDGAHQNQYVTGDYADKISTLKGLMAQNRIKSVVNTNPITDEILEGASLLILSDPQSVSKADYGLEPQKYSKSELDAIARFVEKGGNIAITSKADYGDAKGEYGNATQGNVVLEAIGATVRFNDDQTTDDVENGGQSYRLYFNDYNENSKWLKGVDLTKTYSFYSGSTIVMPNKSKNNIEVLVKGHETTYGNDADKQNDNVTVNKGDVVGLAVETLPNGANVVISGATFFSNFEMDGLDYSNYQITESVLQNLAAAPQLSVSNIEDVRIDADKDNNPDKFGETVVVEGYVTAGSKIGAPGNSFFDVIYVEDETAGLTVFGVSTADVKVGQKVRIKGKVSSYLGDAQVAIKNEEKDLQIIDEEINLVEPKKLSTKDSMLEEKEGLLVKVEGKVSRIEGQSIYVNDGSGESRVYTEGYIGSSTNPGVADEWKLRVNVGDNISAIGLASEDPEGHRLRVRDSAEIVILKNDLEDVEITILHTNDTHGRVKADDKVIGIDTISAIDKSIENSLLVDAGDTLHGLPFATMNKGADIVELMKMSGYDFMAPGNHDFNYGYNRLLELSKLAAEGENGFNILSANVLKENGLFKSKTPILEPNSITEIDGVKVGIFGLSSPETSYKTNPNNVKGIEFADPIETAKAQVKELEEAGAEVIVALAHIGNDDSTDVRSTEIAENVQGIDLIIDGHSHSKYENGLEVGDTLIVSTGEYESNLGKVTIKIDPETNEVVEKTATLINKEESKTFEPDEAVKAKIKEIDDAQEEILSEVVGTTVSDLVGERQYVRTGETNLGNLITDAMLNNTGAEIAITNGGGIRSSIKTGDITKGDLISVLPFGNFIVTKYLTGTEIKDIIEHGIKDAPNAAGQFPHVAGLKFIYDEKQPAGSRIIEITFNNKPLEMDKKYLVATNDFMSAGGDGYPHFKEANTENEFSALDEALREYVEKLGTVDYKVEGRITKGTKQENIVVGKVSNLEAVETTSNSVKIAWSAPENTTGLVGYVIYKDGKELTTISLDNTEYTVEKLRSNTIYGFKVACKYSNGEVGKPKSINVRTKK